MALTLTQLLMTSFPFLLAESVHPLTTIHINHIMLGFEASTKIQYENRKMDIVVLAEHRLVLCVTFSNILKMKHGTYYLIMSFKNVHLVLKCVTL